jgi:hypothetical protein
VRDAACRTPAWEEVRTVKEAKDFISRESNVFRRCEHLLDCSAQKQEVLRRMTRHLLSHARGIALLFEADLTYQGMVLVRSFEELLVDIHYLWNSLDPSTLLVYRRWQIKTYLGIQTSHGQDLALRAAFQSDLDQIEKRLLEIPSFDWKIRKKRDSQSCWSQETFSQKADCVSPQIRDVLNKNRRALHLPVHNDPLIFAHDWDSRDVNKRLMEAALRSSSFACYKTIELWTQCEPSGKLKSEADELGRGFLKVFHKEWGADGQSHGVA